MIEYLCNYVYNLRIQFQSFMLAMCLKIRIFRQSSSRFPTLTYARTEKALERTQIAWHTSQRARLFFTTHQSQHVGGALSLLHREARMRRCTGKGGWERRVGAASGGNGATRTCARRAWYTSVLYILHTTATCVAHCHELCASLTLQYPPARLARFFAHPRP